MHKLCAFLREAQRRARDSRRYPREALDPKLSTLNFLFPSHERTAELHLRESEAVPQAVGGLRQPLEFFAASCVQQIQLFAAVRERGERHTEQADLARAVPMVLEQSPHIIQHDGIQVCRLTKCACTRDRLESHIANRECDRRSAQSSLAEPLHRFLAKQAERRV